MQDLTNYLEGMPLDLPEYFGENDEDLCVLETKTGYLARLSAPGYMDCTPTAAFDTEEEAAEYLEEMYGEDE